MNGLVLVGVDGSDGSKAALAWALDEAAARGSVVEAAAVWQTRFDVAREVYFPVSDEKLADSAKARLGDAIAEVTGGATPVGIRPVVLEGDPAATLCERAAEADLLVVGSRGHGLLTGLLLGSVSSRCADHSPVPVVIVRDRHGRDGGAERHPAGVVVVGVDGSQGSVQALRFGLAEAELRKAALRAVTVWRGTDVDDDMALEWASVPSLARRDRAGAEDAMERLRHLVTETAGGSGVTIEPVVMEGDPADVLCRQAASADLLVIGSRSHGRLASVLLGSVGSRCAHHSTAPVVIVPADRDARPPIQP